MINTRYPKSYGAWAGNTRGNAPDFNRCCESVSDARIFHHYQCSRKRGHGPDQAYCKTHDPEAVAAREKKSHDEYVIKHNKERYRWNGPAFYAALKQIAEGHNDARGLAQEVLKTFHDGESK